MFLWGWVLGPAGGPLMAGKAEVFVPHGCEVDPGQHEWGVDLVEVGDVRAILGYLLVKEIDMFLPCI